MRRQARLADPLVDLRLFRIPELSAALAVYTLAILSMFGVMRFVFQYMQLVAGLSPVRAGVWISASSSSRC